MTFFASTMFRWQIYNIYPKGSFLDDFVVLEEEK